MRNTSLPSANAGMKAETPVPVWCKESRELRAKGRVVKHFNVPAANQELVLAAFQELGWPAEMDDPLPYPNGPRSKRRRHDSVSKHSKRRLHETIDRLNRNQVNPLIRFRGNGNGIVAL
jgi:hypothetical protein